MNFKTAKNNIRSVRMKFRNLVHKNAWKFNREKIQNTKKMYNRKKLKPIKESKED